MAKGLGVEILLFQLLRDQASGMHTEMFEFRLKSTRYIHASAAILRMASYALLGLVLPEFTKLTGKEITALRPGWSEPGFLWVSWGAS